MYIAFSVINNFLFPKKITFFGNLCDLNDRSLLLYYIIYSVSDSVSDSDSDSDDKGKENELRPSISFPKIPIDALRLSGEVEKRGNFSPRKKHDDDEISMSLISRSTESDSSSSASSVKVSCDTTGAQVTLTVYEGSTCQKLKFQVQTKSGDCMPSDKSAMRLTCIAQPSPTSPASSGFSPVVAVVIVVIVIALLVGFGVLMHKKFGVFTKLIDWGKETCSGEKQPSITHSFMDDDSEVSIDNDLEALEPMKRDL